MNVSKDKKSSSKKRATATANDELIERAKRAMLIFGISSRKKLQDRIIANTEIAIGLSTIDKFFNQKPIKLDKFNICKTLKLVNYESAIQELAIQEEGRKRVYATAEETAKFAISGAIDRKLIEEFKSIVEVLQKLTGDNFFFLIIEGENTEETP
ncbi:MAG: hypothetical protein F6K54_08300 [Okeania sp. SIO3B5]|uniref:hypothetical protein n=1 Tax=Okeania sp. SIO3B5 TaxID=2607811 RepID=UPI001400FFBA|nr:hypothetical protein [Okeania sp. SIO3B5]NEO53082.1 hypothetical protein [Okeania sp. SIO3B5]